jgi:DNA-binding MarR family transcriptional regulator
MRTVAEKLKPARKPGQSKAGPHAVVPRKKTAKMSFQMPLTVSIPDLLDEDGQSDRRFRQFLYDFSALAFYLEFAREHLAALLGLSAPQYNCLMIVAQYQGSEGIGVTEVSQHLHVSIPFVTGEIRKLVKARLVDKRRNPEDGRGVLVRLTAKGKAQVLHLKPQLQSVNDRLFGSLNAREFGILAKTAAGLIETFADTVEALKQG